MSAGSTRRSSTSPLRASAARTSAGTASREPTRRPAAPVGQLHPTLARVPEQPRPGHRRLRRAGTLISVVRRPVPVRALRQRRDSEAGSACGPAGAGDAPGCRERLGLLRGRRGPPVSDVAGGTSRSARETPAGTLTETSIHSFTQPVAVAAGVTDELFIAEKPGRLVRWTPSGTSEAQDIRTVVAKRVEA
jgi:hypothetical protein